jgi:molecular chaperone DnaK (HSP70)
LIRPLVESTLDSVAKALQDSGKKPSDMDAILLVGGSTRTPLVANLLLEHTSIEPRQDVHPDLCVALGAGVLASRLAGHSVERVLVDVSPYSFGVSYLGERGGVFYPHCYKPIIRRNTPLPLTRTEIYETSHPYQTEVDVHVYQGDDDDALKNIPVGDFRISGLAPTEDPNEVLCRMRLDLDGILEVTAVEKLTGKSKGITIANALRAKSPEEIAAARTRLRDLFESRGSAIEGDWEASAAAEEAVDAGPAQATPGQATPGPVTPGPVTPGPDAEVQALLERSRGMLGKMHSEDREEAIDLHEKIDAALQSGDAGALREASKALKELLFFVEGQG